MANYEFTDGCPPLHQSTDSLSDAFQNRYQRMGFAIRTCIDRGTLPPEYNLPSAEVFEPEVQALEPVYDAFQAWSLRPKIVFTPEGLPLGIWNNLLRGHYVAQGMAGEPYHSGGLNMGNAPGIGDPEAPQIGTWDVGLLCYRLSGVESSTEGRPELYMTPEGEVPVDGDCEVMDSDGTQYTFGSHERRARFPFEIPGVHYPTDESASETIQRLSPSLETYCAANLLEMPSCMQSDRGEGALMSPTTYTALRERATMINRETGQEVLCALYAGLRGNQRKREVSIDLCWYPTNMFRIIPTTALNLYVSSRQLSDSTR